MTTERNYAELVGTAEKAVAGVKDPELKRVAFQKVLDDLLAAQSTSTPRKSQPETKVRRKPAPRGTSNRSGPQAYVEEMVADGYFKKPKTIAQVKAELENRGHHIALTSLSGPLQKLTQRRTLRRQRSKTSGNKQTFVYSEW